MGNSTKSLQSVVDYASTIGDLLASPPVGGFTNMLSMQIANDVMSEFFAEPFNWKFNRMVVAPFYTISWQQDYASISLATIGWLEHASFTDINNTQLPKPIGWFEVVRDLNVTSLQNGQPSKICWLPNDQLVQGVWPGAGIVYTNPLGAVSTPTNNLTNIKDANGNILVLTTYGTTGGVAPVLPANSAAALTVVDGSCVWTVADPKAQGFRITPLPPQSGVVWQVNVVAQMKPPTFTTMNQKIDPITDDYAKHFNDGFIAYAHRHSSAPVVRARFEAQRQLWFQSLAEARGQGARERDDNGFVPDRNLLGGGSGAVFPIGPGYPWRPY